MSALEKHGQELLLSVPSALAVDAKMTAMRDFVHSSVQQMCDELKEQLINSKQYMDAKIATLQVPTTRELERWLRAPLAALWEECKRHVQISRDEVCVFLSDTRDAILGAVQATMDAQRTFVEQRAGQLRDAHMQEVRKEAQKLLEATQRSESEATAALARRVEPQIEAVPQLVKSILEEQLTEIRSQSADHDEAFRQLTALVSTHAGRTAEFIASGVNTAISELLASNVISLAVRAELGRSSMRAELVRASDRVAPFRDDAPVGGRLPPAASSSSSSASLWDDEELCEVCGGRKSHTLSRLSCACLLEMEPNWTELCDSS